LTPIRAVLFDKDGTLFDYAATWTPTNRQAALEAAGGDEALSERLLSMAGHDPVDDVVRAGSLIGAGNTEELARLWGAALPHRPFHDLVDLIDAAFIRGGIANATPVTDLAALFRRLTGGGMTLGVATNDSEKGASLSLERFGVLEMLAFICGYDSGYGPKPGPGMVRAFCDHTGIPAAEVAVVGDNLHDMEMGAAGGVGLRIGVLTGNADRETLAGHADHVVPSIADLPALLSRA
jgi:phosphoglycolate phosphatase